MKSSQGFGAPRTPCFLTYVLLAEIAGIFPKKTAALHSYDTMKLLEKLLTCSAGYSDRKILRALNSVEQIQKILERERTRAERSASVLSLLAFGPAAGDRDRATLVRVVKILNGRLRTTDVMGWLDRERIAVVLPGTTADGAWQMADNVCKSFPTAGAPPDCQVYSYPTDWLGDGSTDGTSDGKTHAPVGSAADRAGEKINGATERERSPERIVEPMEVLFIQPLPLWKRSIDLGGAILGGLAISPLLLSVALAVKLTSPGPVLFKQQRSGRGGKKFLMYKFRSMVVNAEAQQQALLALNEQDGPAFKIKADPRVTPIGRFLRKTSLDELPQLWNVIVGDMSLVGPRPLVCSESDACQGWQRRRLDVTPGLTCIFQAQGRVGTGFTEWMRMDVRYIKGRTLMHDAKLLWKTIRAVVARKASH